MISKRTTSITLGLLISANFMGCATRVTHDQNISNFKPAPTNSVAVKRKGFQTASSPVSNTMMLNRGGGGGGVLTSASPGLLNSSSAGSAIGSYSNSPWWPYVAPSVRSTPIRSSNISLGVAPSPLVANSFEGGTACVPPIKSPARTNTSSLNPLSINNWGASQCLAMDRQLTRSLAERFNEKFAEEFLEFLNTMSRKHTLCPSQVLTLFMESLCEKDKPSCNLSRMGDVDLVATGNLRVCNQEEEKELVGKSVEELKQVSPCLANPVAKLSAWFKYTTGAHL